jgi:signal recognition particle subunit SRP54
MIGQDAVSTAKAFDERLDITGVILTKLDGDARGGAALSIKAATGKPIKFLGMGETLDRLEDFRPEGLASRILGMGDIVGLMHDFQDVVDEEEAAASAEKMLGGKFSMDDFLEQIKTLQSMGSMKDLMDKMPLGSLFGGEVPEDVMEQAMDDNELVKIESMIKSMTRKERADPELFLSDNARGKRGSDKLVGRKGGRRKKRPPKDPSQLGAESFIESRVDRVAGGSGRDPEDVRALVGRFMVMRDMFGVLGDLMGGGGGGLMGKIPGMGKLKQMNAMRKLSKDPEAMKAMMGGGMPGMGGGMPGMGGGMPGMGGGMPGGMPGMPGGGSMEDIAAMLGGGASGGGGSKPKGKGGKDKRKKAKQARKKNRRK